MKYFKFLLLHLILLIHIRFTYPLPRDALSNGKHKLLEDPSGQYFGMVLQKKAEFKQKTLVMSERSRQKKRKEEAEAEVKRNHANQLLDEEAEFEYCQKMLKQIAKKRKLKETKNTEIEEAPIKSLEAIEEDINNLDVSDSDQ